MSSYTDIDDFMTFVRRKTRELISSGNQAGLQQFVNDLVGLEDTLDDFLQEIPSAWARYKKGMMEMERMQREMTAQQEALNRLREQMQSSFGIQQGFDASDFMSDDGTDDDQSVFEDSYLDSNGNQRDDSFMSSDDSSYIFDEPDTEEDEQDTHQDTYQDYQDDDVSASSDGLKDVSSDDLDFFGDLRQPDVPDDTEDSLPPQKPSLKQQQPTPSVTDSSDDDDIDLLIDDDLLDL